QRDVWVVLKPLLPAPTHGRYNVALTLHCTGEIDLDFPHMKTKLRAPPRRMNRAGAAYQRLARCASEIDTRPPDQIALGKRHLPAFVAKRPRQRWSRLSCSNYNRIIGFR